MNKIFPRQTIALAEQLYGNHYCTNDLIMIEELTNEEIVALHRWLDFDEESETFKRIKSRFFP